MRLTHIEIEAARTPRGGWTRKQLAEWGVPWPPPKGWRKKLEGRSAKKSKERLIIVQFPSICTDCGEEIGEGEQALWTAGAGIRHPEFCGEDFDFTEFD